MITRFAEYVAQQLETGNCEATHDFFDQKWFQSVDRGSILVSDPKDEWKDSWQVSAYRGGFFWAKKIAILIRASERNLPITKAEHIRLYDAVKVAKARYKAICEAEAKAKIAKRLKMTDWP